jgi:hypothetical protein
MKAVAQSLFVLVTLAAGVIVVLERFSPRKSEAAAAAVAAPAALDPAAMKRLASIEARIKNMADGLRQAPDPTESRSADAASPLTVAQRLEAIEASLFDFEKNARRELRLLYDKTRQRFDEIDAKLEGLTSRPATPEERAKLAADLKEQGVAYDPTAKTFEVWGMFVQPTRELEFLAVGDGGRAHEALIMMNATPSAMKRAAVDMGLKPGRAADFSTNRPPEGDGLHVYVGWKGRATPIRIEKLVRNRKTGKTARDGALVFLGSREIVKEISWDTYNAADVYKNVIGLTWNYSGDTVFAVSDPTGDDEYAWGPNLDLLPPPETPLLMTFSKERIAAWEID